MKSIIEGYKQMIQGLIGLVAISPLLALGVAVITIIVKVLWQVVSAIW